MSRSRREFLEIIGGAGVVAAAGPWRAAAAETAPDPKRARGLAKKLTVLTMRKGDGWRLGVRTDRGVLDAVEASALLKMPGPATVDDLLQNEDGPALNALVDAALRSSAAQKVFVKEEAFEYGPVVTRPEKIVCVGLNYRKHAAEVNQPVPKQPVLFSKFNTALNRHHGTIRLPVHAARKFDYEVELVVVLGKQAKNVGEAEALSYVAGYCTGNDFTARDLQLETGGQWLVGKTPDQFAPLGPYMVTADQVDVGNLRIECRVNGETRQSSNTSDMIFGVPQIVSYISKVITLMPGDIIFTGTPEGVIQGKPAEQRVWLKAGDKIACSLEKLGELRFELA